MLKQKISYPSNFAFFESSVLRMHMTLLMKSFLNEKYTFTFVIFQEIN